MGENLSLVLGGGAMNKLNWINFYLGPPFNSNQLQPELCGAPGGLKKWEGGWLVPPSLSFLPALNQKKRSSSTLLRKSFRLQPRLSFVIL